jgi:hypothetical protein
MLEIVSTSVNIGIKAGIILKKYIFIFFLSLICLGVVANPKLATKQQIGMFKNSKTCVVLEDGVSFYNGYIKSAVQQFWKSTEYEFIDQQEFENRRHNTKYSFIVLMKGVFDNDPGGVSYNYVSLVLGDPAGNMTDMPELCSLPLSYSEDKFADFEYVLPAMIKFMQKHARNLETDRLPISLNGLKYYNNSAAFKNKVLLLNKDAMALYVDTPERINTVYPYYVKLLSTSEIKKELKDIQENVLFHFHVGPGEDMGAGKCFEMIFDADGNLYYYNSRRITNENGDGFSLKDFENIN